MRHTASADLGVAGVRPRSFALLSARLRPSIWPVVLLIALLAGCGGTQSTRTKQEHWTGTITTPDGGHYSAALFVGGFSDIAGYYSASASGLSGELVGTLPNVIVQPNAYTCDAGYMATVTLRGAAADVYYSGAT